MQTTMDGVPKVTLALETTMDMVLYTLDVMLAGMVKVPIALELVLDSNLGNNSFLKKLIKNKFKLIIKITQN
jgi:hypothetical protein